MYASYAASANLIVGGLIGCYKSKESLIGVSLDRA